MTLRRVVPSVDGAMDGPPEMVDPDDRERLLELYVPPQREWLRLNLVTSVSGSAAGSDGTSETLTSRVDRRILGVIRELADVVLVGANSVRVEGYQLPKRAALAIVTRSGELGGHRVAARAAGDAPSGAGGRSVFVIGPESARAACAASIGGTFLAVPDDRVDTMLAVLRDQGFASIVCEGGPNLAGQLLEAGVVDEVCLTTRPRLNGSALPVFGTQPATEREVELAQLLLDDDGSLFARWLVIPPEASRATS